MSKRTPKLLHRVVSGIICTATALIAMAGSGSQASAGANSDRLLPNERLTASQSIASGPNTLTMQGDGNLVLYGPQGVALWASNTNNHANAFTVMQGDGNLVVYSSTGVALWATGTNGRGASTLVMQSDGNAVLYAPSGVSWSTNSYRQAYALSRFSVYRWGADQWPCLNSLWVKESRWNEQARNTSSGAYGIPQALPASKMATEGADYLTNPSTQIRWGEGYISGRYGNPCAAWNHSVRYGWY